MKRILTRIFDKKRFVFVFGLLIGVILMGGISYAVGSFTSDSISYTRGSNTMSVKEALDDLIVKVDKKGGNFNIVLAERTILLNSTESTATYKSIVNDVLSKMITSMGSTATMAELTALRNATTLTWTSENTTIASVSGSIVTGKAEGHTNIIGTDGTGKKVTVPVNVINTVYLAERAQQGDYVAYDAGNWGSSAPAKPVVHGNFGGNAANTNKGASVSVCYSSGGSTSLNGWRVLKIESGKVYLVHAGMPECYYHGSDSSDSIAKLDARAKEQYLNETYAESAHAMTQVETNALDSSNTLRKTGAYYWLATVSDSTDLYNVYNNGGYSNGLRKYMLGFRPVVVLKSTVLTTGKTTTDKVGNKNTWDLLLPS